MATPTQQRRGLQRGFSNPIFFIGHFFIGYLQRGRPLQGCRETSARSTALSSQHRSPAYEIWPPDGATCIATLPWIALLALSVHIDLVSSSARVTSVKSTQGVGLTDGHPDPKIGPQVYLGPKKRSGGPLGGHCKPTMYYQTFEYLR